MKFKNFEIRKCVGFNSKNAKYEIVKWNDGYCFVIAFIRWNDKESCWEFDSVGMRFVDHYEEGLCDVIAKFIELLYVIREKEGDKDG